AKYPDPPLIPSDPLERSKTLAQAIFLPQSAAAVSAGYDDKSGWIELANGQKHYADLVVGADGVRSAVRSIYEPIEAHFTGHIAFRGIVPGLFPCSRHSIRSIIKLFLAR